MYLVLEKEASDLSTTARGRLGATRGTTPPPVEADVHSCMAVFFLTYSCMTVGQLGGSTSRTQLVDEWRVRAPKMCVVGRRR
jgi:hypothetical protein